MFYGLSFSYFNQDYGILTMFVADKMGINGEDTSPYDDSSE